jgi:hypothetical protein
MLRENESQKESMDIHNKLVWAIIVVFLIDYQKMNSKCYNHKK